MDPNKWLMVGSIGAILGMLAGFWSRIQVFLWKVCNLVLQDVTLTDANVAQWVIGYLREHYTLTPLYDKVYRLRSRKPLRRSR